MVVTLRGYGDAFEENSPNRAISGQILRATVDWGRMLLKFRNAATDAASAQSSCAAGRNLITKA